MCISESPNPEECIWAPLRLLHLRGDEVAVFLQDERRYIQRPLKTAEMPLSSSIVELTERLIGGVSLSNLRSFGGSFNLTFNNQTTLVIGPNNSGKSTFLLAFHLWAFCFDRCVSINQWSTRYIPITELDQILPWLGASLFNKDNTLIHLRDPLNAPYHPTNASIHPNIASNRHNDAIKHTSIDIDTDTSRHAHICLRFGTDKQFEYPICISQDGGLLKVTPSHCDNEPSSTVRPVPAVRFLVVEMPS